MYRSFFVLWRICACKYFPPEVMGDMAGVVALSSLVKVMSLEWNVLRSEKYYAPVQKVMQDLERLANTMQGADRNTMQGANKMQGAA